MKKNWVDFQEIKSQVTMKMVLDRYGVNWLREENNELRGKCPLHEGEGIRSFHVSLSKNVFHCFSCKAKGNVLDFVAAMEGVNIREAALQMKDWFLAGAAAERIEKRAAEPAKTKPKVENGVTPAGPAVINPALGFQLRVDPRHEYGRARGLTLETLEIFGAGLCLSKGMFAGRFVVPLHNQQGELVGYAGRSVDDSEPKYLFPSSTKGFYKSHLLFNLHRVLGESSRDEAVILVEGFFDCMRVSQAGYFCVALLGSSLSEAQEELVGEHFHQVVLLLDGDEAGRRGAEDALRRLSRRVFVKVVDLPDGRQPDSMTDEELHGAI